MTFIRTWPCDTCGKCFTRKADLTRHDMIHLGERPHICKICHRGFLQRNARDIHLNTHTGVKPFRCNTGGCKSQFGDPSSLTRHRKEVHIKTEPIKFRCFKCGTEIKRKSSFKTHLKQKHGIKIDDADLPACANQPIASGSGSRSSRPRKSPAQMSTPLIVIESELSPGPGARSSLEQPSLPSPESRPMASPKQLSLPSPVPAPMSAPEAEVDPSSLLTIGGVGVQDTQCGVGMSMGVGMGGGMDMYMEHDLQTVGYTHNNTLDVALGPYDAMYPQTLSDNLYSPFYDHHHAHPHDPFFPHDISVTYSADLNLGSTHHLDYYSLANPMNSLSGLSSPPDAEFAGFSSEWDELIVLSPLPISSLTESVGSGSSSSSQYSTPAPATPAHLSSPSPPSPHYATVDPVMQQQYEVSRTTEESKELLEFEAQVMVETPYY